MDLTVYDFIVVNSSAGKDSQAMLHGVYQLAQAQGVTDRLVVVHADLGRMEWAGTRELAEEHARHYGIRFEVVSRPQGDLLQQVEARGMWPSSKARYCTSDHKRAQVSKLHTRLTNEKAHLGRRVVILNCMGLRADESPARAKKAVLSVDDRLTNGKRVVHNWLPIHDWNVQQVWATIKAAGTRPHRAYSLGMNRLSCCFCIFAPEAALKIAARHNPELFQEYLQVESRIGHTFRANLSLADVAARMKDGCDSGPVTEDWRM